MFPEMEKHSCRICGRSFPSGRSLGGHMRSHVVMISSMADEDKPVGRYGLRDNPKKSRRFKDVFPEINSSKPAENFHSLNSSYENELCNEEVEEEEEVEDNLWSRETSKDEEAEEMQSQSDSEVTMISMPMKTQRRRRRSRRIATISVSSSPPLHEYEKEEEYGALCLMMLSKGAYSITDSSDKSSPRLEFGMNEPNKFQSFPSVEGDQDFKRPKISSLSDAELHGDISSSALESGIHNSCKRSKYECTICSKSFHSYQALGGHRASHKKMKGDSHEFINRNCGDQSARRSSETLRDHECSICGRVFASGQALGGHKRSHLVSGNSSASSVALSASSSPVLIDLNLPAPDNEH